MGSQHNRRQQKSSQPRNRWIQSCQSIQNLKKLIDKITNFNPSTDTLEIDTDSFGIDSSATFAAGKNKKVVKKKLAKQDFDFLYDEKKGGLSSTKTERRKAFQ